MTASDFEEQLQNFEEAYTTFINLVETYPFDLQTKSGACGEWSAREVVAHINGWFIEAQRRYRRYAKGTGNIEYNIDAFNQVSLWLCRDKDYEQLVDELKTLSTELAQMARDVPDVYRERDHRYAEWLEAMAREAQTHGDQLRAFAEAHV